MNAIKLLKEDHRKVEDLFEKVKDADQVTKFSLFQEIKTELDIHAELEETYFYPFIRQNKKLNEMVSHSKEEHNNVKELLQEIEASKDEAEYFDLKLEELIDDVNHHVKEEESEMFPKVEETFSEETLIELGLQMLQSKTKMIQSGVY